jgi:hypothetical protein
MTKWIEIENESFYCCDEYQVQYECKECGECSECAFCSDIDEMHEC